MNSVVSTRTVRPPSLPATPKSSTIPARRLRRRGVRWAGVVLCTLLWSAPLPAFAQPDPCETPRRLLDAGLLDAAKRALEAAREGTDETSATAPPCVTELSEPLARAFEERGHALTLIGRSDEAQTAFATAVQLDPDLAPGLKARVQDNQGAEPDKFLPVRQLVALGELSQAREALEGLVKGKPPLGVPEDLQFLHGGRWSWWRAVREWAYGWFPTLLEVAFGLFLLGFLVWVGVRGLRALERHESDPWFRGPLLFVGVLAFLAGVEGMTSCCLPGLALWLGPGAGVVLAFVGLLLVVLFFCWRKIPAIRRKLLVEKIEGVADGAPDASSLGATVCSRIVSLARSHENPALSLITAAEESVPIPEVSSASPTSQGFAAVLSQLVKWLQVKPFTISGTLQSPGRRGPGLTLHFQRKKKVLATTTLWQGTYSLPGKADAKGDEASYALLAELAAVWILFQLKSHSHWPWQEEFELLDTADWQAFAYFQAGVWAFEAQHNNTSRFCFEMALQRDSEFPAAHFNLAKTLYYLRSGEKEDLADKHLDETLRGLAKRSNETPLPEAPGWTDLWDHLEQAAGNRELTEREPGSKHDRASALYFKARYAQLTYGIARLKRERERAESERPDEATVTDRVREFVQQIHAFSQEMRSVAAEYHHASDRFTRQMRNELWLATRPYAEALQPILVSFEVILRNWEHPETTRRIKILEDRIDRAGTLFCFNLAAFLTVYAKSVPAKAPDAKRIAVRCLERVAWLDPKRMDQIRGSSFSSLHDLPEFQDLLNLAPADDPNSLATLQVIGKDHARALAEKGVKTLSDLYTATSRRTQRAALAADQDLEVSRALILRWAQLAELATIDGLEIEVLNVLERGGVDSLDALAAHTEQSLEELLDSLNTALGTEVVVDSAELSRWVDQANDLLPSRVEGGV